MGLLGNIPVLGIYFQKLEEKVADFLDKTIEEYFLSYFLYEFKVEELKKFAEQLQEKKDEIERLVGDEYRSGKRHAKYVSDWLEKVNDIMTKNDEFWKDKSLPYAVCSKWYLPKPGMRYRLAKKAYRLVRQVDNLCKTTSSSDGFSSSLWPMSIDFLLFDVNFEIFASRKQVKEDISKALKDASIKKVGVYGMGGVGKTTLVKEVAIEARRLKLFDAVIFAAVTRNPDIKQIQGQLADQLGARLSEESEIGRASRLGGILKREKRNILVVLDDLWAELDLNKLGIPIDLSPDSDMNTTKNQKSTQEGTIKRQKSKRQKSTQEEGTTKKQMSTQEEGTSGDGQAKKEATNDSKMLKILLTSRSEAVVRDKMHVKENSSFRIEGLNEQEAEVLFKKVVEMEDRHPHFRPLATKISKSCGGLPLAIVTIGKTLRTKTYSQWNETLSQLEQRGFTVDSSTKLSFKYLENEELKSAFLLCAQLGYHPLIMELVKYCIGMGIFEGFLTIKETREKVLELIGKLKDSSLLLDCYSEDRFNIHDLIRDTALSIASEERHFLTMRNGKLKEWPHEDKLEEYNGISICKCDIIDKLPNSVSCPRLKIFHVDSSNPSFSIPEGFFKRARQLRALILTGIDVSDFCASIGCLTNLRMLSLEKCKLDDISFIGKLEKLRILSLSGSTIENLPTELGKLHKLQLLDISNCSELSEIPPNLLSSLNSLEELYMRNSVKWESEENQRESDILAELRHLHELKNLDICLPNVAVLPNNLFLNKLESYKIVIGDIENLSVRDFKMPGKDEVSKVLALQINERNVIHYQKGVKILFRGVEKMLLGQLNGVRNIFCELNLEGFPCLKELWIIDNSYIECIIDPKELLIVNDVFPILESLYLHKLRNMKKIMCHNANLSGTSFLALKVVRIHSCAQLENVFSSSMVGLLKNLATIDISDCKSMKIIVEKNDGTKINFPKLRSLVLADLHNFTGVYSNDHGGNDDSILLNGQVEIPNLESLELSSISKMKELSSQSKSFENLTKLNVTECNGIQYLFSFSIAKSMKKLKSLSVSECKEMEEIFKYEIQHNEAREVRSVFPKLEEIHLYWMISLKDIWPRESGPDSFTSLKSMSIKGCDKLVTVLPSHMVGKFGSLESLTVVWCDSVEQIFDLNVAKKPSVGYETQLQVLQIHSLESLERVWNGDPEGILNFKRLRSIEATNCDKLEYLFPISIAKGLQELNSLSVSGCPLMEEIARGDEELHDTFKFPEASAVKMKRLPKLKCFSKGVQSIEWPNLKELSVFGCDELEAFKTETQNSNGGPIFMPQPQEIIPNLETMRMNLKEVEKLKLCIKKYRMNHLKSFHVVSCPSIEILNQFLYRMPYLERLKLLDCDLKELIPLEENICSGNPDIQETIGTFLQLKHLELRDLDALENIGFERCPDLQYYLEHLVIRWCEKLNNLGPSSVTLTHLTTLEVRYCRGMKNLMGISTAKSLVQLVSLKLLECDGLEQIVAQQKDEVKVTYQPEIVFSKLMTLELDDLGKLSCFCSSEIHHSMEFPALEKLIVNGCPMMTKFCDPVCTAPNLQVIIINEEEENWSCKRNLNDRIMELNKSGPSDGTLSLLDHYSKLQNIWDGKVPEGLEVQSFKRLETLVVERCERLSTVIPSHLLNYLPMLCHLEVRSCSSVVAIFDDVNEDVIVESSKLRIMTLDNLPRMEHVWSKNPEAVLSFEHLQEVEVTDCDSLQTLLPAASITKSLWSFEIKNCGALEEIIGKVEAYEEGAVVEEQKFPCLVDLRLGKLPKLKCGSMKLRCPSLKYLNVYDCGELTKSQIFASESQSYQGANVEDQIGTSNDSHSIFTVQQVSCLEEVSLTKEEAIMLCNDLDTPADVFSKLTGLQLHCFHKNVTDEADTLLPFEILQKLPNVDSLSVACSDLSEIFPPTLDPGFFNLSQLEVLRLEHLPELSSIGIEHPSMIPLQENLSYLKVERCPRLAKLVQSPVSFSNLRGIDMTKCHGLEYIFTTTTARALPKLWRFRVYDCEAIKEIVARAEEDGMDPGVDIIFETLRFLILNSLPRLARFYAGTSTLKFPDMDEVKIAQCPNMSSFSQGLIIAPDMRVDNIPPCVRGDSWCIS